MTIGSNIFGRSGIFRSSIFGGAGGAPVIPWYLSGGIAAANCLAAYTPKGAASLAASYDNNAAPANGLPDGTYDAAPGTAPTWDAVNGWKFESAALQYLKTGIIPATGWSALIQFSNSDVTGSRYLFGCYNAGTVTVFGISPRDGANQHTYWNGRAGGVGQKVVVPHLAAGNLAFSGTGCYLNGAPEGVLVNNFAPTVEIYIGALNADGAPALYLKGYVPAFSVYDTPITAAQVLAVSTAIAAL